MSNNFSSKAKNTVKESTSSTVLRQRSNRVEITHSRPITKVTQRWARIVLRWLTAWELRVMLALL